MRVGKLRVDSSGRVFLADDGPASGGRSTDGSVRVLTPVKETVLISSIRDGATQLVGPVTSGKILAIYGLDLGPSPLLSNHSISGVFHANLAGTEVFFDGVAAPILYASTTQIGVVAPYGISGESANVTVSYQGQTSAPYKVAVAASAPGIFSSNGTGAGQAAAMNADGSLNDAAHPVRIGGSLSLYATGEGQTTPAGQDGKVTGAAQLPRPLLNVKVSVDEQDAPVTYAGAVPGQVAGMMQIVIQIPLSARPGGYVPVFVQVGDHSTTAGAAWIAVSGNDRQDRFCLTSTDSWSASGEHRSISQYMKPLSTESQQVVDNCENEEQAANQYGTFTQTEQEHSMQPAVVPRLEPPNPGVILWSGFWSPACSI